MEKKSLADELAEIKRQLAEQKQLNEQKEMLNQLIDAKTKLDKMKKNSLSEQELDQTIEANENNNADKCEMPGETRAEQGNMQCRDSALEVSDLNSITTSFGRNKTSEWLDINTFVSVYNRVCGQRSSILCRDSGGSWGNETHRRYNRFMHKVLPMWYGVETYAGSNRRGALQQLNRVLGNDIKVELRDNGDLHTIDDLPSTQLRTMVAYMIQDRLTEYSPIFEWITIDKPTLSQNSKPGEIYVEYNESSETITRAYTGEESTTHRGKITRGGQTVKILELRTGAAPFTWNSLITTPNVVIDNIFQQIIYDAGCDISKMIYSPDYHIAHLPEAAKYSEEDIATFDYAHFGLKPINNVINTRASDKITYQDIVRMYGNFCGHISRSAPNPILLMEEDIWTYLLLDIDMIGRSGDMVQAIERGSQLASLASIRQSSDVVIPGFNPSYSPKCAIAIGNQSIPVVPIRGISTFVSVVNNNGVYTYDTKPNFARATVTSPLMTMVNQNNFKMSIVAEPELTFDEDTRYTNTLAATLRMMIGAYVLNPKANGLKLLPAPEVLVDDDENENPDDQG